MERVLIVAKTRMANGVCVSGLVLATNEGVRLLSSNGSNQPTDTGFDIGQIWDLDFQHTPGKPPHVEDVRVYKEQSIGHQANLRNFLIQRVQLWQGGPDQLFDGLLQTNQNGKSYISRNTGIPNTSTGFWLPDHPLHLAYDNNRRLCYFYLGRFSIPYVGFANAIRFIPAKTLVRVSLARWWMPTGANEERCYLQLSGWYF